MRYAETGFNLEIDLSRGSIERVETDPKLTELYLGPMMATEDAHEGLAAFLEKRAPVWEQ